MNRRPSTLTLSSVFFSSVLAIAPQQLLADRHGSGDALNIPVASQAPGMQTLPRPHSGQKGSSVIAKFGEPLAVTQPVGEPPITRWDYANYYVYFEYDHVIRSVLKHPSP